MLFSVTLNFDPCRITSGQSTGTIPTLLASLGMSLMSSCIEGAVKVAVINHADIACDLCTCSESSLPFSGLDGHFDFTAASVQPTPKYL